MTTPMGMAPPRLLLVLRRFFRTPKGYLIIVLAILTLMAALAKGFYRITPGLISSLAAAALMDAVILRLSKSAWEFPDGALLSGWIIALILSPEEPWYVTAITAVAAVASKYIFRTRSANIFNPAALAIFATYFVFETGQSWWGALPENTPIALAVLFAAGIFITDRVNKMPLVLSFLGSYYLFFTLAAYWRDPRHIAEIFRIPDVNAALFFAFFILTDPPTSPVKYPDQIWCGVIVAAASCAIFVANGAVYFLLGGVLVGNVWEAWRRVMARRRVLAPTG